MAFSSFFPFLLLLFSFAWVCLLYLSIGVFTFQNELHWKLLSIYIFWLAKQSFETTCAAEQAPFIITVRFLSLWNVEIVCVLGIVIVLHPPMPKTQTNHWKVFNSFGRFSLLIFIYNFEGKLYLSVLFLEFLMIYLVPYWAWSDSFDVSIDIDFDFIVMKCNIKCCRWIGMFFS